MTLVEDIRNRDKNVLIKIIEESTSSDSRELAKILLNVISDIESSEHEIELTKSMIL